MQNAYLLKPDYSPGPSIREEAGHFKTKLLQTVEQLLTRLDTYGKLSTETISDLKRIVRPRSHAKGDHFLTEGQIPRHVAFVLKGLFSQYYTSPDGGTVIKKFFPENHFAGSIPAALTQSPGMFAIKALEPTETLEYNFHEFKNLTEKHRDLAAWYIRYMELHWIIEKEPLEISFRHDNARTRYLNFLQTYPNLEPRLKQHEIAAYLGITPTQLSRIRSEI